MYRRNVMVAAAAVFALGVAFAAQPTSNRTDRVTPGDGGTPPWIPGTDKLMSAHESGHMVLAPPR